MQGRGIREDKLLSWVQSWRSKRGVERRTDNFKTVACLRKISSQKTSLWSNFRWIAIKVILNWNDNATMGFKPEALNN